MKTSNKLLFSAILLILLSLVVYDTLLKAEYQTGNYKDPYKSFVILKFSDFDILDIHSSTAANVKFVQGPFSVRIDKNALDYVAVSQDGPHLRIDATFEGNYLGNPNQYILLISCPKLLEVNTNAGYRSNNREVTDTIVRSDWNMRQVLIEGFNQDALFISQDYGSTVVLANNHIRAVKAVVGKSPGSGSNLIIKNDNEFQNVTLAIDNNSKLFLDNAGIQNLNYQLADSASLTIRGNAKDLLVNSKPEPK